MKYWNVASVNGPITWNSDVEDVLECSKCERTRPLKQRCWGSTGM